MLEEFLKKNGSVTGTTYTKEQFASIIKEANEVQNKVEEKEAGEKPVETKEKKK